jgi:hypothetical protein
MKNKYLGKVDRKEGLHQDARSKVMSIWGSKDNKNQNATISKIFNASDYSADLPTAFLELKILK